MGKALMEEDAASGLLAGVGAERCREAVMHGRLGKPGSGFKGSKFLIRGEGSGFRGEPERLNFRAASHVAHVCLECSARDSASGARFC